MGHGTDYGTGDRKGDPASVTRPCEGVVEAGATGCYLHPDGTYRWLDEEQCPFGAFVEGFPLCPDGEPRARELGMWVRWTDDETGEYLPDAEENWPRDGHWEPCGEHDGGARPDLNRLIERNLLDGRFACPTYGHDCPAYYGFIKEPS